MRQLAAYLAPAAALAAVLTGFAGLAQTVSGDPVAGAGFAQEICATCHRVEPGQHGVSLEGAPAFQDVADDPAVTSIALRVFLRSPHEEMPDFMLSETETDDIIAYILSLK